jgi:hypothetical protein
MNAYIAPTVKSFVSFELVEFVGPAQTAAYLNFNVYNGLSLNNTAEYKYCQVVNSQRGLSKIVNLEEGCKNA